MLALSQLGQSFGVLDATHAPLTYAGTGEPFPWDVPPSADWWRPTVNLDGTLNNNVHGYGNGRPDPGTSGVFYPPLPPDKVNVWNWNGSVWVKVGGPTSNGGGSGGGKSDGGGTGYPIDALHNPAHPPDNVQNWAWTGGMWVIVAGSGGSGSGGNKMPDQSLVLQTTKLQGSSGWLAVVVTAVPNFQIFWGASGAPSDQIWLKNNQDIMQLQGMGSGSGSGSGDYLVANTHMTLFLIPLDSQGNVYAPSESVYVPAAPGIYLSEGVPDSEVAQLKAQFPGLNVYSSAASQHETNTATKAASGATVAGMLSFGNIGAWISDNPVMAAAIGIGLVLVLRKPK